MMSGSATAQPAGREPGRESVQAAPAETLEEAWQIALTCDQGVAAGGWNVSAASHLLEAARAERLPSLTLGANCLALSDEVAIKMNAPPLPSASVPFLPQTSYGFQAMVNQPLYTSGRVSSGINAAGAELIAKESELSRTTLDVKMNVSELYIAVLRSVKYVEIAEEKVSTLGAHLQNVESRLKQEMVSRNDLLASQVALANAQQQAAQARNILEMARAAYNRALGRSLSEPVQIAELGKADFPGSVDELTASAFRYRPEINAISAEAQATRDQAEAVRAKNRPQVGVQGGVLYQEDKYVTPNGIAGAALTAEWKVFDSGRTNHQAESLLQKAEAMLRLRKDMESRIALEVRQKWLEMQTAQERFEFARKATAQADENLRVVVARYGQGMATNTEVLDGQTMRAEAYLNLYNSSYETLLALFRLRRAVGNL